MTRSNKTEDSGRKVGQEKDEGPKPSNSHGRYKRFNGIMSSQGPSIRPSEGGAQEAKRRKCA